MEFISALVPGHEATIVVRASVSGNLDAWVDFKSDGSWAEPEDRIFHSRALSAGDNELTFTVSPTAELGVTYARFRFSKTGGLIHYSLAPTGEVEDYRVVIEAVDWGDLPDEPGGPFVTILTDSDPHAWDRFGSGVAIQGDWAFVGAYGDLEGPDNVGAVHVFRRTSSGWVPHERLTASDGEVHDKFGSRVFVHGDALLVSASGAAYVFRWDGFHWVEEEKLTAPDPESNDNFGIDVCIWGDYALVGASKAEVDGESTGSAYVFHWDGTDWDDGQRLTAFDGSAGDQFGCAVAISGEWALVGAENEGEIYERSGAVYVFRRVGASWEPHQKLKADDAEPNGLLGSFRTIAISGDRFIVGARGMEYEGEQIPGGAYIFELDGPDWAQRHKLTAPPVAGNSLFGYAATLSGDLALVHEASTGTTYLFRWDGDQWIQQDARNDLGLGSRELVGPAGGVSMGGSVSISGNTAIVGDIRKMNVGLRQSGGAYIISWVPDETDYPTLLVNDGARHNYLPGMYLGSGVDFEPNGQVTDDATGDDLAGIDDDDGVTFSPLVPGVTTTIEVQAAIPAGTDGYLNAWIDFNNDGDWDDDPGEQIFDGQPLASGPNTLHFHVPASTALLDQSETVKARFRFSSVEGLGYGGWAPDGEVEDYALSVAPAELDFGDAPDPTYPTTVASDGARHVIVPGMFLGDRVDAEPDGQADPDALGDDLHGDSDENGVNFVSPLASTQTTELVVTASADGFLDAWVDFNADGDWEDWVDGINEQVFVSRPLTAGANLLSFDVPLTAVAGRTFARFRFSSAGGLSFDLPALDGEVEDYAVQIAPLVDPSRDLGPVDFHALDGLAPVADDPWYRLETTHAGFLSLVATYDSSLGTVPLTLYDDGLLLLASSAEGDGSERIDHQVTGPGKTYYFRIQGPHPDVDLRLVNLVRHDGVVVTAHGTVGDDPFAFDATDPRVVSVYDVPYEFSSTEASSFVFDGGAGNDELILNDSPGDDTLTIDPGDLSMTGVGYSMEADAFESVLAYARNGGTDVAVLHDTPAKDKYKGYPTFSILRGGGYFARVKFFEEVLAYAGAGGNDRALLFDSPGDDKVKAEPERDFVKIQGSGFFNRAKFFPQVTVYASSGHDEAVFEDTTGNDIFRGLAHKSQMYRIGAAGLDYEITVRAFDEVLARAGSGFDKARLFGSSGDDHLLAKSHKSEIKGPSVTITARDFDKVNAFFDEGGFDTADLYDTPGDEFLEAADDWVRISTDRGVLELLYDVAAFESVLAHCTTGDDTADVDPAVSFLTLLGGWRELP